MVRLAVRLMLNVLFCLLIALVLSGCGPWLDYPEPNFTSPCGMKVYDTQDEYGFQLAEERLVAALEKRVGWPAVLTCMYLAGREVWVMHPGIEGAGPWYSEQRGYNVAGEAHCPRGMLIGSDDWYESAFSHEGIHLLQGCKFDPDYETDPEHPHWKEDGFFEAIGLTRRPIEEWRDR